MIRDLAELARVTGGVLHGDDVAFGPINLGLPPAQVHARVLVALQAVDAAHLAPRATLYWPWLAKEIVKSAWDVTKVILSPKLPAS